MTAGEVNFSTNYENQEPAGGDFSYIPGSEDIQMPFIRLAQGLTPEVSEGKVRPGQWILPDGSVADRITGIILGMRRTRAFRLENEIVCRSNDAVTGTGNPGGPCSECPMSDWVQATDSKTNIPPRCTLNYQYLMQYGDDESGGVGVISMSTRSASKVSAQINLQIRMHGAEGFRVTLGSSQVVKGQRKFHAPTLVNVTVLKHLLPDSGGQPLVQPQLPGIAE